MNGATTAVTCPTGNGNKCVTTQAFIDSLIVSEDTGCNARKDGTDDDSLPLNRVITEAATEGTGALTIGEITDVTTNTCKTRIGRHVLSLDSMPEAADIVAIPCAAWDGSGASDTATTATTEAQCHALQDCGAGSGGGGSNNVYGPDKHQRYYTPPQLEVAVLPKQPKVHTKVMNVPTVVHVMVKAVYVHVTKVTPANPAKHKQFWFSQS